MGIGGFSRHNGKEKEMTEETAKLLIYVIGCSCVGIGFIILCAWLVWCEHSVRKERKKK